MNYALQSRLEFILTWRNTLRPTFNREIHYALQLKPNVGWISIRQYKQRNELRPTK